MVSSFSSPDCKRFQILMRGSLLVPKDEKSRAGGSGSSGKCVPKKPSNKELSGFLSEGGSGFSVVKKEKISEPRGLSLGPGPGISMSRPWLMNDAAWTAPQSEVTKPLKPSSWRRILIRVSELPQA